MAKPVILALDDEPDVLAAIGRDLRQRYRGDYREDAIADWLEAHGVSPDTAPALAETAVSVEALDELAGALTGPRLDAALGWIAAGCTTRSLVLSVERTTLRIQQLVSAMKRFAQHRGELDLDSRPGATRFTVRLPLAEPEGTHPLRAPVRDLR